MAGRADAPEDDFSFVNLVARSVRRCDARPLLDVAVDVSDLTAGPAHQVVVVVTDAAFVPHRAACQLEPPEQSGRGEGVEHVIRGLNGNGTNSFAHSSSDLIGGEVALLGQYLEHGDPRCRDPEVVVAQQFGGGSHCARLPLRLELIQHWKSLQVARLGRSRTKYSRCTS